MRQIIIMQGIPGSGKSTLANMIADQVYDSGSSVEICSADDFFMEDGQYVFDMKKIGDAHKACQDKFRIAVASNIHTIIVDNTNIKQRDCQFYIDFIKGYPQYETRVISVQTPLEVAKKHNAARENGKAIPEHVLERMHSSLQIIRV